MKLLDKLKSKLRLKFMANDTNLFYISYYTSMYLNEAIETIAPDYKILHLSNYMVDDTLHMLFSLVVTPSKSLSEMIEDNISKEERIYFERSIDGKSSKPILIERTVSICELNLNIFDKLSSIKMRCFKNPKINFTRYEHFLFNDVFQEKIKITIFKDFMSK